MIRIFTDPACLDHQAPPGYPERPDRLSGVLAHLREHGWPLAGAGGISPEAARADVLYASTHQYPFYPGTGAAGERGIGAGEGATLNVPLPAGTGDERYGEVIREQVLPALRRFAPDVLVLSAGFDAWQNDPL